jgi:paraquat-inducible protein B
MFVLGALLLAVVGFLSFGGSNIFGKPTRFSVYFEESVSGLDPGAAVKLDGVRVGRVAAINVRYDATNKQALVQAICEIDHDVLADSSGRLLDLSKSGQIQELVDHGLRARLVLTGITGLLFVELDFDDPSKHPAPARRFPSEPYPVVPSIPSPLSEVQQSIIEIVADMKKIDFAGLGRQLSTLLATTNQKVSDLDVKELAGKLGRAADAVQAFLDSPEARNTFANLNQAINDARATLARVDAQVDPLSGDLKKTLADAQGALQSLNDAAKTTRQFVRSQDGLTDEVTQALRDIAAAAGALERLANMIERNPSSLIVGKKKAPGAEGSAK